MLAFTAGIVFLGFFIRCARCKGNLGLLHVSFRKSAFGFRAINFCPYCGVSLDTRIEA